MAKEQARALISVYDKSGIIQLAQSLLQLDYEIVSTGGTKRALEAAGIPVTAVSSVTGFPEVLDGRVKTLHPHIHAGILAIRECERHQQHLEEQKIMPIDLVVTNLYPFQATIAQADTTFVEAIEQIDIGGPAMVRAAAKNHNDVTVLVDATDYDEVISQLQELGEVKSRTRKRLAAKAFQHTAQYDAMIARYLSERVNIEAEENTSPTHLTLPFELVHSLRYGENPHQASAFYKDPLAEKGSIALAKQLHGKRLSYNNIQDADAALMIIQEYNRPTVVAVKHMNPCGIGQGDTLLQAYERAYEADPLSIFGGIVACNGEVDGETANKMRGLFLEIVLAPSFTSEALAILQEKKNIRLLQVDMERRTGRRWHYKSVSGGLLVQERDQEKIEKDDCRVVTKRQPSDVEWEQLLFAWKAVKHVKSNAIVLVKGEQTIGIGAGQMNRVGAAEIAIRQAGEKSEGSVLASDAFFPMGDTVEATAAAGVCAIIQPGGSIRDEESIMAANRHGIAMVFTGVRHFKH
ncbi:bifunctional phosphoribosylaminoimidazolecarboxamide formyltransferase/IMP cyclohydrolase [Mechercharimyces sp. CAU 1602]|uniref:bifunctional phosphoribosylaminoimidazolecarboxamide formyltransferase/IMP cyclohydrolase n=1 Tax=Mechercharimyces sp. CAU 1602 TaxID=2973933 RepID=UPI002163BB20|nr:bifunctional phosphoribosylaminoimidazolecarboxamide formyltransferase/IMP cyclohydrolase [Mechercharimyces sp. CAU 1602]MCS1352013.1 bifunctional phosphoribosylaminoimidazolecarboxamide formyltransferase/IMP cyclohydrolase [Mechercharimyces sp. CAU 1602]